MSLSLKFVRTTQETPRIRSLFFVSANGATLPEYSAGAHLDFDLGGLGTRSYSLINLPAQTTPFEYHIAVQREDDGDGGSKAMHALSIGDTITATDPKNDFPATGTPAILLAGGIGVTPILSLATELAGTNPRVLYAGSSSADMAFQESLPDAEMHYDADSGIPDLPTWIGPIPADHHLYVCGPKPLIEAAKAHAETCGLSADHIHFELFKTAAPQDTDHPFEVEIKDTGDVHTIPVGKSIIEVLEEAGMDLMYDCQRGDCGICQTDVIEGTPDHRDVVLSDAEKASGKVMQICVSRAKTPRLVLDL